MRRKTITSTPGKLMLLGEHAVVYNRPCIVTAVDFRFRVTVEERSDGYLVIDAPQLQNQQYKKLISKLDDNKEKVPKEVAFVKKTVEILAQEKKLESGITVSTESDFSHRYGFGSSSAVTVGTLKALCKLYGLDWSKRKIFNLAYRVTLSIQGVGSGFDIAAAVYGGTLYFVTGGKKIEKIIDKPLPLVVGYSGTKADTPTLVRQVAGLKEKQPKLVDEVFRTIEILVEQGKDFVQQSDWESLGDLFRINQGGLYSLGVSTPKLDEMCSAALLAGAYGAKLSGAGGGDCMIALVSDKKKSKVEGAIESAGGEAIPVITSAEGVRVEE